MMKKQLKKQKIMGWMAVGLSTVITCGWAFFGISRSLMTERAARSEAGG